VKPVEIAGFMAKRMQAARAGAGMEGFRLNSHRKAWDACIASLAPKPKTETVFIWQATALPTSFPPVASTIRWLVIEVQATVTVFENGNGIHAQCATYRQTTDRRPKPRHLPESGKRNNSIRILAEKQTKFFCLETK
jgi:hypothetical protein